MVDILTAKVRQVTVSCENDRVLIVENGRTLLELPWSAADDLVQALKVQARRAETNAKAVQIINDQAILARAGFFTGLTNRLDLLKEACKEAAWNSTLRRYIPSSRAQGIASQAVFGTPTIIRHRRE